MLGAGKYEATEGVLFVVVSGQRGVLEHVPGGGRFEGSASPRDHATLLVDVGSFDEPPSAHPVGAKLALFDECLGSAARHLEHLGGFGQRQILHGLNVPFLEHLINGVGLSPLLPGTPPLAARAGDSLAAFAVMALP